MAQSVKKISSLLVSLETKPGALCEVFEHLAEAGISVLGSWGYQMGPNEAQVHVGVADPEKAAAVLKKMGKDPTREEVVLVEGDDRAGAYAALLKKITAAKINIEASDALVNGSRFSTAFFAANSADVDKIYKALQN